MGLKNNKNSKDIEFQSGNIGAAYIEGLAAGHYSLPTSIAELLDNSEDAGATKFWFDTSGPFKDLEELVIADNGTGMTRDQLLGSFTLGLTRPRNSRELGKFGFGGTVSMFNVADEKITLTRSKAGSYARKFDMDDVRANDTWGTSELTWDSWMDEYLLKYLGKTETGTVIILRKLRGTRRKDNVVRAITSHCSITYGEKINVGDAEFFVNGEKVEGYDPLYWYSGATRCVSQTIKINGHDVVVRLADLSNIQGKDLPSWARNFNATSGGYFYRNGRLIKGKVCKYADGSFGQFFPRHPDYRFVRWAVYYGGELDGVMNVSFDKTALTPDSSVLDKIAAIIIPDAKAIHKATQIKKKNSNQDLKDLENTATELSKRKQTKSIRIEPDDSDAASKLRIVEKSSKPEILEVNPKIPSHHVTEQRLGALNEPWIMEINPDQSQSKWILRLNLDHRYISTFWTNGDSSHRDVVKVTALSTCFANLEIAEDDCIDILDYRGKVSRNLNKTTTILSKK